MKPSAGKPKLAVKAKVAKSAKKAPSWIGSGKGKGRIKPGVDLTKPTYALGQ